MNSISKENYLKTIFLNIDANGEITSSTVGKKMKVSIPTVNNMAKKLHKLGWVSYEKYKPLKLTEAGRKKAAFILRKHRIAEIFLVEKMGISWEFVHDIAEEMEHIHSNILFSRMDEMLNHPTTDPHGSPIPDKDGNIFTPDYLPLSEIEPGQKAKLCSIAQSCPDFLDFLNKKDISIGTEFHVIYKEDFDKSMTLSYLNHDKENFSAQVCERLRVEAV